MTKPQRQTTRVKVLLDEANRMLAIDDLPPAQKQGICDMIEFILHETGNYSGYSYNHWKSGGFKAWCRAGKPEGPEKDKFMYGPKGTEWDRCYHTHSKLT